MARIKRLIFFLILLIVSCVSAPQRVEIPLPATPQMPTVQATKNGENVEINQAEFVALVKYIALMKGHVRELEAIIEYYKGDEYVRTSRDTRENKNH